jgi:hypothetical protein
MHPSEAPTDELASRAASYISSCPAAPSMAYVDSSRRGCCGSWRPLKPPRSYDSTALVISICAPFHWIRYELEQLLSPAVVFVVMRHRAYQGRMMNTVPRYYLPLHSSINCAPHPALPTRSRPLCCVCAAAPDQLPRTLPALLPCAERRFGWRNGGPDCARAASSRAESLPNRCGIAPLTTAAAHGAAGGAVPVDCLRSGDRTPCAAISRCVLCCVAGVWRGRGQ